MIKQLDADGNVVLVMSQASFVALDHLMNAADISISFGLTSASTEEKAVFDAVTQGVFELLTDEQIIEASIAPHRDHPSDPLDDMLAGFQELIPQLRAERAKVQASAQA